ncbi:VOC family protein [Chloroflexota bacterium]
MFKRIDHVEIIPTDFDRTISFYTQILGFTMRERSRVDGPPLEEIAYLELGDTVIEVMLVTNPTPVSKEAQQVGYKRIALEVENMGSAVEYLKSKGVEITWGPIDLGTSIRAEFEDPDGLSVELREWKT